MEKNDENDGFFDNCERDVRYHRRIVCLNHRPGRQLRLQLPRIPADKANESDKWIGIRGFQRRKKAPDLHTCNVPVRIRNRQNSSEPICSPNGRMEEENIRSRRNNFRAANYP